MDRETLIKEYCADCVSFRDGKCIEFPEGSYCEILTDLLSVQTVSDCDNEYETHESDANYDVLSVMRDFGLKPDAETLRFILSQYRKIITETSHGMLSKLTYLADEYIKTFREHDTQSDKWISCNDRLPEFKKDVLIYAVRKDLQDDESPNDEGNHVFAITSMSDELWIGHAIKTEPYWVAPFEFFRQNYSVTHWMELPENPEVNTSLG